MAYATKRTATGTERPDYVPMRTGHVAGGGTEPYTAAGAIQRILDMAAFAEIDDDRVETARETKALLERAAGEQVMISSDAISTLYDLHGELGRIEIAGMTFTSHEFNKATDRIRSAVKNATTRDLGLMDDEKWDAIEMDGIAESSSGTVHLVEPDGTAKCGSYEPDADDIEREIHFVEDFSRHADRCSTCTAGAWRMARKLGLR